MANVGINSDTVFPLSAKEGQDLVAFKQTLNTAIPAFYKELGTKPVADDNAQINEPSLLTALDNAMTVAQQQIKALSATILTGAADESLRNRIAEMNTDGVITSEFADIVRILQARLPENHALSSVVNNSATIIDEYESLSPLTREKIATGQQFFAYASQNSLQASEQGFSAITLAQSYLDIDDPDTKNANGQVDIAEKTTRALRDHMEQMRLQNPDLDDFHSASFDQKAVRFLQQLQAKQMQNAGIGKDDLSSALIHIWTLQRLQEQNPSMKTGLSPAMEELGKTSSMLSAMNFMVSGALASNGIAQKPNAQTPWDLKWENDNSGDHFFNLKVYDRVLQYGEVDIKEVFKPSDFQFKNDNLKEAIERLREQAKLPESKDNEALQNLVTQVNNFEEFGTDSKLTHHQIGLIAVEIMSIQANKQCIDDKDINRAIESGRFMPHLSDLSMVDTGMGYPPGALENVPAKHRKHDVLASFEMKTDLLHYRSEKFASRFGEVSEDDLMAASKRRYGHLEKVSFVEKVDYDHLNKRMQSPSERYNVASPEATHTAYLYNQKRERYLSEIGVRLEENNCKVPASDANGGSGGVKKPSTDTNVPNGAGTTDPNGTDKNKTGADDDNQCVVDAEDTGGCLKPKDVDDQCVVDTADKGPCSRGFASAASNEDDTNGKIIANIGEVTGNDNKAPDDCGAVDQTLDRTCNAPAATGTRP